MRIVVALISTDRPASLIRLVDQLTAAGRVHDVRVTFLVVENSTGYDSRARTKRAIEARRKNGVQIEIEADRCGDAIGPARKRARDLVARDARVSGEPDAVWFLDDDVELVHEHVADGCRRVGLLYDAFALVVAEARKPAAAMLIGTVSGDPPIPAIATYASRLEDLVENITRLESCDEREPWPVDEETLALLATPDAYYDFSTDNAAPSSRTRALWLPREGEGTVADAREALLDAVRDIPVGGSFTRPLLATTDAARRTTSHTNRGGNCVFFDVAFCLAHPYPAIEIDDVVTRRSEMIGATMMDRMHRGSVMSSGMAVWHNRDRNAAWPTTATLIRSLLGDTWGAMLARFVRAWGDSDVLDAWFETRVVRINEASARWAVALHRLRRTRTYRRGDPRLQGLLAWADRALPMAPRGLASDVMARLTSQAARDQIIRAGNDLLADLRSSERACAE